MAVRLSGIILPPNKHIRIALRSVYGIGSHRAMAICKKVGIEPSRKVNDLKDEYNRIRNYEYDKYDDEITVLIIDNEFIKLKKVALFKSYNCCGSIFYHNHNHGH